MRRTISPRLIVLFSSLALLSGPAHLLAEDVLSELQAAKQRATRPSYLLRYKFLPGEQLRYKVVHLTTTETRIMDTTDRVQTRSVSTKLWKVTDVDPQGQATFVHTVEDVDMWNRMSGAQENRYNSRTDAEPPVGYDGVAESIGVPLATVTVGADGTMVKRVDREGYSSIHGEQIVDRLPPQAVRVGDQWFDPREIILRDRNGRFHRIKTRKFYRLEKVSAGLATIRVETQVLTPVHAADVRAQLVKWLTSGEIKFDIDAGRVLSQQLNLDERVIGFNGAASIMEYVARRTETLLPPAEVQTADRADSPPK